MPVISFLIIFESRILFFATMKKGINGYEQKNIPINRIKWSYVTSEGLGLGGTYEVFGEIRIREQSNNIWSAQIVAEANAQSAKGLGDVTFSANAFLYVDGSLRDSKPLTGNGAKMNSSQIKCNLGTGTFILPQNGTVEIELEVRYTVITPTGAASGLNLLGDIGYKINKKLGKALGKIRERIN